MVAVNLLCLQTPHHQETELSLDNKPAAGRAGHTTGMLTLRNTALKAVHYFIRGVYPCRVSPVSICYA